MQRITFSFFFVSSFIVAAGSLFAQAAPQAGSVSAPGRITQEIDDSNRVVLPGNTHPLARAEFDQGPVDDGLVLDHVLVVLKRSPDREQALETFLSAQQNPSSPAFHQWLTAPQFGEEFGPAASDVQTVANWLQSRGFQINRLYPSGLIVDVTGTAGQIRNAFGTAIHRYSMRGGAFLANVTDPTVPAALAPLVAGTSLNSFHRHPRARRRTHYTQEYDGTTQYYLTPADYARIYNAAPAWAKGVTGVGQSVVVLEDSDMLEADWETFVTSFGLASYGGTFSAVNPDCSDPGRNYDEIEVAVDAESVSTFAPGAAVQVAACPSTYTTDGDITAAINLLSSSTTAVAFSDSYGACEAEATKSYQALINNTWQQAAAQGIAVFVAAGDEGPDECDYGRRNSTKGISVDGTASSPYVVAVGGTDFSDVASGTAALYWSATNTTADGSARSYIPEVPWNGTCASNILANYLGYPTGLLFCNTAEGQSGYYQQVSDAGSGGPSMLYAKPAWQAGVVGVPNDNSRDLPDVSLFASAGVYNQSIVNCMSDEKEGGTPCDYNNPQDTFYNSGGGTSDTAPLFAGIFALITQKTGAKQGLPNPELYALAAQEYGSPANPNSGNLTSCNAANGRTVGASCIFYDITQGNNDIPCTPGTRNCFSLPGDKSGVLSLSATVEEDAFTSTPGWDFTTGLGSVNVTNLVNAWPVAPK